MGKLAPQPRSDGPPSLPEAAKSSEPVEAATDRGKAAATRGDAAHASDRRAAKAKENSPASLPASNVRRQDDAAARPAEAIVDDRDESLPGEVAEIPERLGGYRILRLIGRGAMGAVYEAKQVSLDRLVALKTIRGKLADSPASLARFAREAYAAAQLSHHNVVQIYDFGEDEGRYFFSMEWVRGGPLDRLIREKGSLDPRLAAGYALQAARGLQYAHRNGMVHRDIKPANLLLTDDGVIKVADLGLVKVPETGAAETGEVDWEPSGSTVSGMASGTEVTLQGTAVGTPAYMAPEQGIDAASVDHRADIYALGCSLFCMLTGHPPFAGSNASEVMDQHVHKPVPRLRAIDPGLPEALERVVAKATAKRPSDRYASISDMVEDLEAFLGVRSDGSFSPSKSQAQAWEAIAQAYGAASAKLRFARPLIVTWAVGCLLLTLLLPLFAGWSSWLLAPAMLLSSLVTASLLAAHRGKSPVVTKAREWLESMSWSDWGIGAAGLLIGGLITIVLGGWLGCLAGLLIGGMVAAIVHFALVAPCWEERAPILRDAERFVRDLRIEGADETGLREFIARYSGRAWQPLFEDLFGYDALDRMRQRMAVDPSFAGSVSAPTIRDKVCHWLAAKTRANHDLRDQRRLAKIEERGLASEGLSAEEARERAWQIAAAIMEQARSVTPLPASAANSAAVRDAEARAVREKRARIKAMLADARSGRYRKQRDRLAPLKFWISGQTRLLAGLLLLAWFAAEGHQQGIFDAFKELDTSRVDLDELGSAIRDTAAAAARDVDASVQTPEDRTGIWSIGIAGLFLSMSAFVSGWRMTPFALVATLVILFGPALGIPSAGPLPAWLVSVLAALVIYLPGIIYGESEEE